MSDFGIFTCYQGNYNIVGEVNRNVINFTVRNSKLLNNIFIGSINNVDTELDHKITCAFAYNKYTIIEDLDNNKLTIVFNFYDDTTLVVDLFKNIN